MPSACPSCGAPIAEGSKFCGICGAPLGGAAPLAPHNPVAMAAAVPIPPPRSRRARWVAVGSVVAAVVVVVGVLVVTGVFSPAAAGATTPVDSSKALSTMNSTVTSARGSGWQPVLVDGTALASSESAPVVAFELLLLDCGSPVQLYSGTSITIPSTPPSAATGESAEWLGIYVSNGTTGTSLLLVMTFGSSGLLMFEVTSVVAGCVFASAGAVGSVAINSTHAAAIANEQNGTVFLHTNDVDAETFALEALTPPSDAEWTVEYTTCAGGASLTGGTFVAEIDAVTGAYLAETTTVGCG